MASKRDSARREHPGPPRASDTIQPQELIVTLFGAYVGADARPAWSGGLVELMSAFGCTTGSSRIALNRVVERGLLERHREGRFISYAPTERLRDLIAVGDRRMAALTDPPEWDSTWTVVWYSIPDELRRVRHRLGRRLRFLGFGPLEDSTWVAPRDQSAEVLPYLERLGVRDRVGIIVGDQQVEPQATIARAWDDEELALRYRLFNKRFAPLKRRGLSDAEAFVARTLLSDWFRRFPYLDPGLPADVFPAAKERDVAGGLFRTLYPALAKQAQRHFDATTRRLGPADFAAVREAAD
ncbi:MAG: PaaX family transcriptional regulator [Actinobacteria bacterium]|nr:PaaX family transcriptional regulator [Actinomycetota bacterium]